jgi:hypothetical protein
MPQNQRDAKSGTHAVAASSVAGLATLDSATATQVTYSAASVAKKKVGATLSHYP